MSEPLVVIVGPTASGKSALAMEVARRFNGEIICADSRTIYKDMDIGTAKPTKADQDEIPHHLLDIVNPGEVFSVAQFKKLAQEAICDITRRKKLPIMVGGTGLYIDAVLFDFEFGSKPNTEQRHTLQSKSIEELQELCRENNINIPLNKQNKRHLIRAIETGGVVTRKNPLRKHTLVVGITIEKEKLESRIIARTAEMVQAGILDEVKRLGESYGWESEAMTGNIYRIFKGVIEGTKTMHQALYEFVQSDMQLAKRQRTWFKRNPHIVWSNNRSVLLAEIEQFVRKYV